MVLYSARGNWMTLYSPFPVTKLFRSSRRSCIRLKKDYGCGFSRQIFCFQSQILRQQNKQDAHYESLRLLEWDKVCDLVSSFAGTSLGREATKEQLWSLNNSYEDSLRLLQETNAALEMHKHGACRLEFTGIDLLLVKSAVRNAQSGMPVSSNEALAVATMLAFASVLKLNLESALKEDADWYNRFMPLSQMVMEMDINRSLIKMIQQVIDEDGSIRDSASSALKRSRDHVQIIEKKLSQLMDSMIRNDMKEASFLEVSNVNGRWCINSGPNQLMNFRGLLLSSDSGRGSILEPLSAVPLNDELQRARASVAKAEVDVLLMLTEKMQKDLDNIRKVLGRVIQLDVVNARATYSLSFGGACPDIYVPDNMDGPLTAVASEDVASKSSYPSTRKWILYMPKAHHPLLLQQHRQNLEEARKAVSNASTEIRRKFEESNGTWRGETDIDVSSLEMKVSALEQAHPVPVDFFISQKTRVLIITGPNTGGKTICLKTVGLAAMMAKSGLLVLASESVQLPWFDYILADIGDEQSLSQSLSTFSGHLKQISEIRSQSTNRSLVLLDEVGAGTNPLEGAALGMSLLESFADSGALLTIATTHHGELKSLKYSNGAFENACMEFDEVNLKPTYKILWGVPGRSNAINISEKLGLPEMVISNARELYGTASAEINEVIIDMERFKQDFQELLYEAKHYLMLSRNLHEKLLLSRRKIMEHDSSQRYWKIQELSEAAALARSILHKKVRQLRAHLTKPSQPPTANEIKVLESDQQTQKDNSKNTTVSEQSTAVEIRERSSSVRTELPQVGDTVQVLSLGAKATVLKVDQSKEEMVVQAGTMKLKLKFTDISA